MGRLSRPLNKEAIKKADVAFYIKHPELVKNGQRIPLSANDASQADLHKEWQQLYQQYGGEIETAQEQFAAKKPDDPVQPCPIQPKNWIDLEYLYADGQGVSGTRYEVFDSTTDGLLTAGALNGKGKAHVNLPLEANTVKVRYFNDPAEVETIHESQPQAFPEPSGWFDRMTENIKSAGNWTWEVIQGDFNENPTIGQIATNAVITAIPVVDQVADVRDIVAIVKQMVWDKRNDIATWFALFITVIGLVPTVGSLLKGMLKAIWHGAKPNELLKLFNYFKKGNAVKWLKELRAGKLKEYAQQAADNAHKLFDALSEKLIQLKAHVPKAMSDTHKALEDTLTRLGEIKGQINRKFAEIADSLKQKLGKSLDETEDQLTHSNAQTRSIRQQEMEEPVSDGYNDIRGKNTSPDEAFHYTEAKWKAAINENGLRPGSYATPAGDLSPTQAAIELALPPNRNLPDAKLRIDLEAMRKNGFEIPEPTRVSNVVTAGDGRVYTQPGGGYEMKFDYEIPSEFISIVE